MVRFRILVGAIGVMLLIAGRVPAQQEAAEAAPNTDSQDAAPAAGDQLSVDQARLADRFKRLEETLGQLAEFAAASDPTRARLLREAIARSREQDINVRFESIVKLLEDERLAAATNNQTELQQELETLLDLLLKADRDKELASERDRIRKYLKETMRLLRMQRGIRARTEGGDELRGLGEDQQQVADDTKKLGGELSDDERKKRDNEKAQDAADNGDGGKGKQFESSDGDSGKQGSKSNSKDSSKAGEPSDGESSKSQNEQPGDSESSPGQPGQPEGDPPANQNQSPGQPGQPGQPSQGDGQSSDQAQPPQEPTDRAAERLRRAAQQMEDARKKLEEAEREGAADRQHEAMRELEKAKAELERVLRQLREEELERTLTQLATRFRRMLDLQNQVYEGTVRLDEVPEARRDHDDEIESGRLSRQEAEIVLEADKALLLLREEGSSIAFPEIVEQMRDDMRIVVTRLAESKVGTVTQGVEEDIIAALEETIAALEQARKDLEKKRTPPGGQSGGGPADPDLVDELAELKLIRSLQMRINQRTQRYGKMIEGEQAETPELLEALEELSERQRRLYQAIMDLERGRND